MAAPAQAGQGWQRERWSQRKRPSSDGMSSKKRSVHSWGGGSPSDTTAPCVREHIRTSGGGFFLGAVTARVIARVTQVGARCWLPKDPPVATELEAYFSSFESLLPAPLPEKTVAGLNTSKSSRLRSRLKRRLGVGSSASAYVATLNALDEGKHQVKTSVPFSRSWSAGHETALAQLHSSALREASRLERVRRDCGGPTGVASLAT